VSPDRIPKKSLAGLKFLSERDSLTKPDHEQYRSLVDQDYKLSLGSTDAKNYEDFQDANIFNVNDFAIDPRDLLPGIGKID
jgi:hypothetical protein